MLWTALGITAMPEADNIDPVLHYATERSAHSFVTSWSIGTCLTTFPSQ